MQTTCLWVWEQRWRYGRLLHFLKVKRFVLVVTALHASAKLLLCCAQFILRYANWSRGLWGVGVQKLVSAVDVLCDWVTVSGYIILVYSWLPRLYFLQAVKWVLTKAQWLCSLASCITDCVIYPPVETLAWCMASVTVYFYSYMLSPVRLSSVTFMRPTQVVHIFGNISMALGTLAIRWHPLKNFAEIVPGEPLRRES